MFSRFFYRGLYPRRQRFPRGVGFQTKQCVKEFRPFFVKHVYLVFFIFLRFRSCNSCLLPFAFASGFAFWFPFLIFTFSFLPRTGRLLFPLSFPKNFFKCSSRCCLTFAPDCFYCSKVDTSTLQFINCNRADQTTERETLCYRSLQVGELCWLYLLGMKTSANDRNNYTTTHRHMDWTQKG